MTLPCLIGERIEGDWNRRALEAVAATFGAAYRDATRAADMMPQFDWVAVAENVPGAPAIYDACPPAGARWALVVGSEAHGVSRSARLAADAVVQIPLVSANVDCLNVAAAGAICLRYLTAPGPLPQRRTTLARVQAQRPDLLIAAGPDPRAAGSAIRSACAFGWEHLYLHDPHGVWFTADHALRAESRGGACRAKNPIKVLPSNTLDSAGYRRVAIVEGAPPAGAPLVGTGTLVAVGGGLHALPTLAGRIERVESWLAGQALPLHLTASLALAEIARQLGSPGEAKVRLTPRRDRYRCALVANRIHIEHGGYDNSNATVGARA